MIFSGASRFGLFSAGARWRWLVAALVASLVLVGVSAWGAESAHAGLVKDVQLIVVNHARGSVTQFSLCTEGSQDCPLFELKPNNIVSHTAGDVSGFMASSVFSRSSGMNFGYLCDFSAHNPAVGVPYFVLRERGPDGTLINILSEPQRPDSPRDFRLSEGDQKGPIFCGGFDVVLLRKDDTSYDKVMQLTITKVPNEPSTLRPSRLKSVSAGRNHTCGVRFDDTVACWGDDGQGQARPPTVSFKSVSAGALFTCGVQINDQVACWGNDQFGQARPPTGSFKSVSAGFGTTCGVRTDGTVACWGNDQFGQARPPAATFESVSSGWKHTCGVRTDDTVACWGNDQFGQARPPTGSFKSVSASYGHTCGVRTDDTVTCWGNDQFGQARPPANKFKSVSAGGYHTCGVRTDGTVACWGDNKFGQATPPADRFESVSAGFNHTCGVRTDGTVACWGDDGSGQVLGR